LETQKGNDSRAWVCLKGVVYDVTENKMYDRSGRYNLFAGRDASGAIATMTFEKINDRDWRNLSKANLERLDDWCLYFKSKYKVCAYLREEYDPKK
jgi:cytochrome b involved in lipid metabolism